MPNTTVFLLDNNPFQYDYTLLTIIHTGNGRAYEDDGDTTAAKTAPAGTNALSSVTTASWSGGCSKGDVLNLNISSKGRHAATATSRRHRLQLRGCGGIRPLSVAVNGRIMTQQTRNEDTTTDFGWWIGEHGDQVPSLLYGDTDTIHVAMGRHMHESTVQAVLKF